MKSFDQMTRSGTPRVLVLLATYNGALWIEEQFASILEQRDVDVVVRVSDDCSTDGTVSVIRRVAAAHANVELSLRPSSSGSAGANFKGLLANVELDGFDYVALADQDDVWDPDHLSRGCAALWANPGAGGYSCAVRTFGAGKPTLLAQSSVIRPLDFLLEGAGQGCTFVFSQSAARLVQHACHAQPQLTAAIHYHDWMIYLVVRCSAASWIFDQHPSLRYRQHAANEIGARSGARAVHRRLDLIRDGWYARQVAAALALATSLAPLHDDLERFGRAFSASRSLTRRVRLACLVMRKGRRRFSDRLVLCISVLVGWI